MRRFLYQLREVKQTGEQHHSFELLWQDVESENSTEGVCGRLCSVYSAPGQDQLNKSIPDRCLSNLFLKASKDGDFTIPIGNYSGI